MRILLTHSTARTSTPAMKLLNPGNASHTVALNDKNNFRRQLFTGDSPGEAVLYDTAGTKVMELEKVDVCAARGRLRIPKPSL